MQHCCSWFKWFFFFLKMAVPPGKTPISYLQEYCTKRGLTPQYDLIANEGAVHEPTFLMRVTVGDVVATGKGSHPPISSSYLPFTFIAFHTKAVLNGHYTTLKNINSKYCIQQ